MHNIIKLTKPIEQIAFSVYLLTQCFKIHQYFIDLINLIHFIHKYNFCKQETAARCYCYTHEEAGFDSFNKKQLLIEFA